MNAPEIKIDKAIILEAMNQSFDELEALLATLDPEQMTRPGVYDDLSVKDILAHIAAWERLEISWIETSLCGEVAPVIYAPGFEVGDGDTWQTIDRLNQHIYEEHRDRPLDLVLIDLRVVHIHMVELVNALPEDDLIEPNRFDWRGGEPLWQSIAANSYEHYREHIELIQSWLEHEKG
jgi:hypothetical protein